MIVNKVEKVFVHSGILSMLFTNHKNTINNIIQRENNNGWRCSGVSQHLGIDTAFVALQLLLLMCTLGLYTFGSSYLLLFEKDTNKNSPL